MTSITTRSLLIVALLFIAVLGAPSVVRAAPVPIGNSSFEVPELTGGFAYAPAGATWSFTGGGGISGPPSGFGATPAPDGDQYAFLQAISSFFQEITVPVDGTYVLTFLAAGRPEGPNFGGDQIYRARLDSDVIFAGATTTDSPILAQQTGFVPQQSAPFFATAGTHTLTFEGFVTSGDHTAFIDAIAINAVPRGVPEPSAILLLSVGVAGLVAVRPTRARRAGA